MTFDPDAEVTECQPAPASMGTDAFIMMTEWGPAFCALPPGFPVCPRCEPDETFGDDITAIWIANWDARAAAIWYRSALEAAGLATASVSSIDDPEKPIVIESLGPRQGCRVQTLIEWGEEAAALEGHPYSYVAVRYGTGCQPP